MARAGSSLRRPRIAVADDSPDMRTLIATTLGRDGYDVVEAADGGELLACVERLDRAAGTTRAAVDLVVSDVSMPGPPSLEVLRTLRDRYGTPIILMTGFADDAVHAEARAIGAIAILDKPFELDALCSLVRRAVRPRLSSRTA